MRDLDFSLKTYEQLLVRFDEAGYRFCTLEGFFLNPKQPGPLVILRHDVDRRPANAVLTAAIEHRLRIRASYYFRTENHCYDTSAIRKIVELGHELGYHYEDLAATGGDFKAALKRFEKNLVRLREFYPVRTICMHGSPLSRWDNRLLWKRFDYTQFGIIGDSFLDLDFRKIFYLSDTGRGWNRVEASIRDKVTSAFHFRFKSTFAVIAALREGRLPPYILLTTHPQRWNDDAAAWMLEWAGQGIKNVVKRLINRWRPVNR